MATILLINAISSLLAALGVGGWFIRARRRAQKGALAPVYVTTRPGHARGRTRA